MAFAMPHILGLSPQSYYHNPRGILHPDNGLVSNMASCQRLSSSLPNQDALFRQQSPAIVYSRGGKSMSGNPGIWQTGVPDSHRSVLVHTGSPAQPVGPLSAGQHPSIIQFSPTNHHMIRPGDAQTLPPPPPPDSQQAIYCDTFPPQATVANQPSAHPEAQAPLAHPQHCQTVIQQQKNQAPPAGMESPRDGQRPVTVKEENLDQAYLDDGECKFLPLYYRVLFDFN